MEKKKEKWAKPKLIVLVRGDRQEGVLQVCKSAAVGSSAVSTTGQCAEFSMSCGGCAFQLAS